MLSVKCMFFTVKQYVLVLNMLTGVFDLPLKSFDLFLPYAQGYFRQFQAYHIANVNFPLAEITTFTVF